MAGADAYAPSVGDERASEGARPVQEGVKAPSELDYAALFEVLKGWFRADAQHSNAWRVEAKKMFDFRAGNQWTPEDKQKLEGEGRVPIVFNRVLTVLKAVAGMEINGRHEIEFIPQETKDAKVNELLTSASKWMGEGCDAEDEQSSAFEDCCTCGMGWTESRLDFEDSADGKYIEESVDPLEMFWDRTAKKKNLSDSRRMWRVRKMPVGDAMALFPGKHRAQLDAKWAVDVAMPEADKTLEDRRRRDETSTDLRYDDLFEVTLVHVQWWERQKYWIVADVNTNSKAELSNEDYQIYAERMQALGTEPIAVEMTRKLYKEAFIGSEVLLCRPLLEVKHQVPGQPPRRANFFTWKCITGEANKAKGTWFGLGQVMHDPQMWANKWLQQTLHILNSTAKGGILAEKKAFDDAKQAEETYAQPDAITWLADGALSSANGARIMAKPGGQFPQGHIQLMEFAIQAIYQVTGINLELLGLKDINQPGVLEMHRKQAGMTVLATMFDSLRRYRKQVGRVRLFFIQTHFSAQRLIRIVGEDAAKDVQMMQDRIVGEYDVVVDDAPTSPNQKEANWAIIQPMLVVFKDELAQAPELFAAILEYSPLPSRLVEMIKLMVEQKGKDMTPEQQLAIKAALAKISKDETQATLNLANAGATQAESALNAATAEREALKNNSTVDTLKEAADINLKDAQADKLRADAGGKRVDSMVTAMTPIPKHPKGEGPNDKKPGANA